MRASSTLQGFLQQHPACNVKQLDILNTQEFNEIDDDLLSLGFVLLANWEVNQCSLHVYAFDIMHYKTTPDWLNSKNWANPELWDKYWW